MPLLLVTASSSFLFQFLGFDVVFGYFGSVYVYVCVCVNFFFHFFLVCYVDFVFISLTLLFAVSLTIALFSVCCPITVSHSYQNNCILYDVR